MNLFLIDQKKYKIFNKRKKVATQSTDFANFLGRAEDIELVNLIMDNVDLNNTDYVNTDNLGIIDSYVIGTEVYNSNGKTIKKPLDSRTIGIRPSIKFSEMKNAHVKGIVNKDIIEVEYGEYPSDYVLDSELLNELNQAYINLELRPTDKTYSAEKVYYEYDEKKEMVKNFQLIYYREYEYKNKKYVRINDEYWFKVEPIKWYVSEKNDLAITSKIISSGIDCFEKKDKNSSNSCNMVEAYIQYCLSNEFSIGDTNKYQAENFGFTYEDEVKNKKSRISA